MCPESFGDVRFDLGALLEGPMWSLVPIMVYFYCVKYLILTSAYVLAGANNTTKREYFKINIHVPRIFWWGQISR